MCAGSVEPPWCSPHPAIASVERPDHSGRKLQPPLRTSVPRRSNTRTTKFHGVSSGLPISFGVSDRVDVDEGALSWRDSDRTEPHLVFGVLNRERAITEQETGSPVARERRECTSIVSEASGPPFMVFTHSNENGTRKGPNREGGYRRPSRRRASKRNARAFCHSRLTVRSDTSITAAVSSTESPPKKRSSTTRAGRSLKDSSSVSAPIEQHEVVRPIGDGQALLVERQRRRSRRRASAPPANVRNPRMIWRMARLATAKKCLRSCHSGRAVPRSLR